MLSQSNGFLIKTTDNFSNVTVAPTNFKDSVRGIAMNASGELIASAAYGAIMKWVVANNNWTDLVVNAYDFYSVSIADRNTWYFCGDTGIMQKTTDGGQTFTRIVLPDQMNDLFAVDFKNANEGFVTGKTTGKIYHTTNGGVDWTNFAVPGIASSKSYRDLFFVTDQIGYAIGGNFNAKTTDGGTTWTMTTNTGITATTYLISSHFKNENIGLCGGAAGKLYVTTDGAQSWTNFSVGNTTSTCYINDIYFWDDNHGVLVNTAGEIFYTTTGGMTAADWTAATEGSLNTLYSIARTNDGTLYVAGYSNNAGQMGPNWGVLKSVDNGVTWTEETIPNFSMNPTQFVSLKYKNDMLVAAGKNQIVIKQNLQTQTFATDLFISEYIEGSSNNKAIEIFNGTGQPVNLANYSVRLGANGLAWTNTVTPHGMLANNDVYIIANSGANATILALADTVSNVTYYNGDDALGLFHGTDLIDVLGTYLTDPGTAWSVAGVADATLNHTMVRKPTVISGTTDWALSAGTNVDNSEWIVYPIDTITYLGAHEFTPGSGTQTTSIPTYNPGAGTFYNAINVTLSCTTAGASIHYTTDGAEPTDQSPLYTAPIAIGQTTTIKAKAFSTGLNPSPVSTALYTITIPVDVATIASLRSQTADGTTIYKLTTEAVISFQQTYRHQKYVQDATAGVLIDDLAGLITNTYNTFDGITGIIGKLSEYAGMIQFTPVTNAPVASSSNNMITPIIITPAEFNSNFDTYESRVVKLENVHFSATGNFANGTVYMLHAGQDSVAFRSTFYDVNYITHAIPQGTINVVGIPNSRADGSYLSARDSLDFSTVINFNAPSNLVATPADANVTLTWQAPAVRNLAGYKVYRNATALNNEPITNTTYNDNTVTNGTTYSYYITAVYTNPNGESVPSNTVNATPQSAVFNAPTALTAVAGIGYIDLNWTLPASRSLATKNIKNSTRALNGIKVYRNATVLTTLGNSVTTYHDATVVNGTTYQYYVTATYTNPDGESVPSNTVSATPIVPVFNAPTNLVATAGNAVVDLTWNAPAPRNNTLSTSTKTRALSGYKVYRNAAFLANATTTTYHDATVTNGTSYSYYVTATYSNPDGESVPSNTVSATPVAPVFNPPTNLVATAGNAVIDLAWTAPAARPLAGYKVYRNATFLANSTTTTYHDAAVTNGTTYSYYVTATYTNPVGESVPSNTVSATPTAPPVFAAPSDLAATVTGSNVNLTWSAPGQGGPGSYISYDGENNDGIGTGGAATFAVAARFTATELADYNGATLTKVKFFPREATATYTVKVWTGGSVSGTTYNAGTVAATQAVASITNEAWNEVNLATPVTINSAQELWIGYEVVTATGYPAGCDAGPQIEGKGNMMYFNNVWSTLSQIASSLTYNWNIKGFVQQAGSLKAVALPTTVVEAPTIVCNNIGTLKAGNFASKKARSTERPLASYKVYRDGSFLANATATTYADANVAEGAHTYYVTAVYTNPAGESVPSNTVNVTISATSGLDFGFEETTFPPTDWSIVDLDGDTYNWESYAATNAAHTGTLCAASASYDNTVGPLTPDNWLITQQFNVLPVNNDLTFWVAAQDASWPSEHYSVKLSTTGAQPADFTVNLLSETLASGTWTQKTIPLAAYANQNIRIAFEHHAVTDMFMIKLDDVHLPVGTATIDQNNVVTANRLMGNYPNPFNPETTISFDVVKEAPVSIDIYNVKGQKVKTLVNNVMTAGTHTVVWRGDNNEGNKVTSGVYFYKMNTGSYTEIKKMVMMK